MYFNYGQFDLQETANIRIFHFILFLFELITRYKIKKFVFTYAGTHYYFSKKTKIHHVSMINQLQIRISQ